METNERIEIRYPVVFEDVREAVRIRMLAILWWRVVRWAAWGAFVLTLLVAGLALLSPSPEPGEAVRMTALGLVAVAAAELAPWAVARSYFAVVRAQGEATAVVEEDGARWSSRDTETTIRWALLPRYVETPRLFVLLTAKQSGSGFAYLPKRGLTEPGEVDRLRAVLDRNTSKV
ncbi:YcxB family protein [Streptomyces sp. NPDC058659]|uniref:YcxB family protein n=1 Tax=unclassified Streptomyces TaxID=2593676 RepID=UPI00364FFEB3